MRRVVLPGIAVALAASIAACAWLAGIDDPRARPADDGGGPDVVVSEGGASDGPSEGATCPFDRTLCGDSCVDLLGDPAHCGSCTTTCSANGSCVAGHCVTAEFYIGPGGSDSNPGTIDKPWRTFAYALPRLEIGDALVLLDGQYKQSTSGVVAVNCHPGPMSEQSGTASEPIVLAALHERMAVVASDGLGPAVSLTQCHDWVIYGLTATMNDLSFDGGYSPNTVDINNAQAIELRGLLVSGNNRYFRSYAVNLGSVDDSLLVDSEVYDFTFAGVAFSGLDDEIRRVYVNSRGAHDIDGGAPSYDPTKGDDGILYFPNGGVALVENVISEGSGNGFDFAGLGAGSASVLGSVAFGCSTGLVVASYSASADIRDVAIWNTTGSGLFVAHATNVRIAGATLLDTGGVTLGLQGDMSGTDVAFGNGVGVNVAGPWTIESSNSGSNPGGDCVPLDAAACQPPNLQRVMPTGLGANPNQCVVYVAPTSNMIDAGADGGPVGANVWLRYEDGGATTTKLWRSDGTFPCGAVYPGINDVSDASCLSAGARLNFVDGGCPVP